jgi:Cytochrome c3
MIRKRRMLAKIFGLLLSLLLLSVFTSQMLFAVGLFCSDKHIETGLNCENCHGAAKVAAGAGVGMAKCLSCHGSYEKLAKRTGKMTLNPHVDYHLGELDCNVCHHGHRADENYCDSCHK